MSELKLSPFYHSAVNSVTKPNQFTATSDYFIDRWMPLLGGNGTMIVLALRRDGFLNRKTGECRDEIVLDGSELAKAAGMSEDTLIREMGINKKTGKPQNEWLGYFVQKRGRKRRSQSGRLRQEANAYWVAMDDPIHPDDWTKVAEAVVKAEERNQKQPDTLGSQFAYPVGGQKPQTAVINPQTAAPGTQTAASDPQNAYRLNTLDSSSLKMTIHDTAVAASDKSFSSSFHEQKQKEAEQKKPAGRSPAMSGATAWLRRREGKPDAPPK